MKLLLKKAPFLTGPLRSYFNYLFGEKEIRYFSKYLKKYKNNFIFIDVGANYGVYTFMFGGVSEFTYAIEPIPECIDYIDKGYINKNIEFINKVASNNTESKILNIPIENNQKVYGRSSLNNNFNKFEQIISESFKLDELLENIKRLNSELLFIKIDVEGHENLVIEGTSELFKYKKSILLIEIESRHNEKYQDLIENLTENKFVAYYVKKNKLIKIEDLNEFIEIMKYNINFVFKNY